jgi:hypothetical protein
VRQPLPLVLALGGFALAVAGCEPYPAWYAVTTDGGVTWKHWDVPRHLPDQAFYNPRLIKAVSITRAGRGR